MKKQISLLVIGWFAIFFGASLFAQTPKVDSLLSLLKKAKGAEHVNLLIELGEEHGEKDKLQAFKYCIEAYKTSGTYNNRIRALEGITDFYPNDISTDSLIFYNRTALECSLEESDTLRILQFLVKKGWHFYSIGEYKLAREDFKKAYDLYLNFIKSTKNEEKIDPYRYSMLANNLGVVYTKSGIYDSAIHYLVISLEEKVRLKGDKRRIVMGLYNLSGICIYKEDYTEGLAFAERSLVAAKEIYDTFYIVRSLNNMGVLNKNIGNTEKAILYYKQSIELSKKAKINKSLAISLSNLGVIYSDQKKWLTAKNYFLEALDLKEKLKNKSGLANSINHLSSYYLARQEYDTAIFFAEKSLALSTEIGEIKISEQNFKTLSKAHAGLKQFDEAYNYQKSFFLLHDSLYNLDSDERYNELQTKYQTAEKGKRILEQDIEVEKRKTKQIQTYWIGGGFALVFVFIIILILLKRRKDNIINQQEQLVLKQEKALSDSNLEKSKLQEQELKNEVQYKSKQLTTHALNMMQKNTLMQEIQEELVMVAKKANTDNKPVLNRIKMLIKKNLRSEKDWDLFKLYFEDVNKQFYEELAKINSELTSNDLKLCALLKLNMNIKESASVMNIEPASVKTARYKLRKKLELKPEDDLVEFIRKIG